jgi:hypothetical protein
MWQSIETAPRDGTPCLFYSPGKKRASNQNADAPYYRVDSFSPKWPSAHFQYPEAPYTYWLPLPEPPTTREPIQHGSSIGFPGGVLGVDGKWY